MNTKQTEALKLALEALEETRNALAWFYDSYPQDVTSKGNALLPHVETVLTAIREALAEQPEHGAAVNMSSERVEKQAQKVHEQPAQQFNHTAAANAALNDAQNRSYQIARTAQQQEPVALLNAIRAEPTEMIHKWRVIDIIQSTPPQGIYYTPPASKPLSREVIERDFYGRIDFVRQVEAAHGIKGDA